MAHLRQDRTVDELDHRMHDALRMNHHVDARDIHVEKPTRFDHFQPLVEQGRGIDGDFFAHPPSRMPQRLLLGHRAQLLRRPRAKGPAARRENQAANMPRVATFEALENGIVLAVDRQDAPTMAPGRGHDHLAGHDEHLFAGQSNVLPRLKRRERGT